MERTIRKTNDNPNDDDQHTCDKGPRCIVPHRMARTEQNTEAMQSTRDIWKENEHDCVNVRDNMQNVPPNTSPW